MANHSKLFYILKSMSNSSEEGHYNYVPMPSFNLQPDKCINTVL